MMSDTQETGLLSGNNPVSVHSPTIEPDAIIPEKKKREPRDYQKEAIDRFYEGKGRGLSKMMIVLPTGAGKTFVFTLLTEQHINRGERVLILAHRDELISQAVGSLTERIERTKIGIVKGPQKEREFPVVVASVASLASKKQREKMPKFDLIIIDESHRSLARSYRGCIEELLKEKGALLGVTATPKRGDGAALAQVYQEIVYQMSLGDAINKGWLSHLVCKRIKLKANFDELKLKANPSAGERDFDATEVCTVMDAEDWEKTITDAWLEFASDRKTIGFLPSVAFAHRLAVYMQGQGIKAIAIDGTTDKVLRRAAIAGFGTEYQVLLNCALLVEGVDLPVADCCISAAMTASLGRLMQSIGRVTRKSPGKENALILDVVGVTKKNRIQQSFNLGCIRECHVCRLQSSLDYKSLGNDLYSMPAYACLHCFRQIKCFECGLTGKPVYRIIKKSNEDTIGAYICKECMPIGEARLAGGRKKHKITSNGFTDVNLLAESRKGDKAGARFAYEHQRMIGGFRWTENTEWNCLTLDLKSCSISIIHREATFEHPEYYEYYSSDPLSDFQGRAETRAKALDHCEAYAKEIEPEAQKPSGWVEATENQIALLKRLGFPESQLKDLGKGEASSLISQTFEERGGGRKQFDSSNYQRRSNA